jgi:hypothetical protein
MKNVIISGSKHVKGIGENLVRNLSEYNFSCLFQTACLKVFCSSDQNEIHTTCVAQITTIISGNSSIIVDLVVILCIVFKMYFARDYLSLLKHCCIRKYEN